MRVVWAIACAPDLFWVPHDGTWSSFPAGQWLVVGGLLANAARRSWDAYRLVNYRKAISVAVPYAKTEQFAPNSSFSPL